MFKIGDKVVTIAAFCNHHTDERPELVGLKGTIVSRTDHDPASWDWIVVFDKKLPNEVWIGNRYPGQHNWWFKDEDLRLQNAQMFFQFNSGVINVRRRGNGRSKRGRKAKTLTL
jgi:hypothetical protein